MSNTDSSADKRVTGTSERREQIIQRLRQQGSVQVNDLSEWFGVSTVTIRNDLAFLEKQGIAVRAYGGALICDSNTPATEPSVEDKSSLNTAVKRSIAKAAVELIKPGHRVILDSGTTTYEIARLMRQHTDVIAMTNGMNVANALLESEGVELLMTGGHLRRQSQSFYGDRRSSRYRIITSTFCSLASMPLISSAASARIMKTKPGLTAGCVKWLSALSSSRTPRNLTAPACIRSLIPSVLM